MKSMSMIRGVAGLLGSTRNLTPEQSAAIEPAVHDALDDTLCTLGDAVGCDASMLALALLTAVRNVESTPADDDALWFALDSAPGTRLTNNKQSLTNGAPSKGFVVSSATASGRNSPLKSGGFWVTVSPNAVTAQGGLVPAVTMVVTGLRTNELVVQLPVGRTFVDISSHVKGDAILTGAELFTIAASNLGASDTVEIGFDGDVLGWRGMADVRAVRTVHRTSGSAASQTFGASLKRGLQRNAKVVVNTLRARAKK